MADGNRSVDLWHSGNLAEKIVNTYWKGAINCCSCQLSKSTGVWMQRSTPRLFVSLTFHGVRRPTTKFDRFCGKRLDDRWQTWCRRVCLPAGKTIDSGGNAAAKCWLQFGRTGAAWQVAKWLQVQMRQGVSQVVFDFCLPYFQKRACNFAQSSSEGVVYSASCRWQVLAWLGSRQLGKTCGAWEVAKWLQV
ncbi:unnamed protein product [Effrenium voratum]|uniref:Uncharacterized protein n=1 Tax=Effrenium voratum TaxID=2562239 RepID=A0AA36J503_9DINO|nr:unnamed protein product [Effrenium voratum]CAJ1419790.1 unnamed protein product [Effrenium voratum]